MIRKATAITFILLANIVLLAHAVFPHHHHDQKVCLSHSHCHHTSNDSSTHPADCTHEHDSSDNPVTNCTLKQLVVVPANQYRIEPVVLYLENFTDCYIFQPEYSNALLSTELLRINPYPKDVPLFQIFIDYSQSLRAPPAV